MIRDTEEPLTRSFFDQQLEARLNATKATIVNWIIGVTLLETIVLLCVILTC